LDTVGKPNEEGEYEKKPLDFAGREAALLELQDFAGEEFLRDFEKWYTRKTGRGLRLNWIKSNRLKRMNLPVEDYLVKND
jgi:hypothetical protein